MICRKDIHLSPMNLLGIVGLTTTLLLSTFIHRPTYGNQQQSLAGIVYTESNIPTENGNTILGFRRDAKGNLTPLAGSPFATGGAGIVDPTFNLSNATLGSDQEIIINPEHTRLFAVNSGSNTISVFNIAPNGSLSPVDGSPFPSGGVEPVSLALAGDFLYVANKNRNPQNPSIEPSNSLPNYTGFRVQDNGKLTPIENSTVEVPHNSAPAHVLTSPNKKFLFAADELTGLLYSFKILPYGRLKQNPNSPQPIPATEFQGTINPKRVLGLQVHPHLSILYVGFFTVSKLGVYSYDETTGQLKFLRTVPNSGEALCWIYVNKAGTRLYTANAIDRSVSVYDLTDATKPVEIQKVTLKGDGNSFQIALDESTESFLHVVTQRAEPTDFFLPTPPFESETESNGLHTLKVNPQDGTLTEVDSSPVYILPVAGSRPQGVVAL